MSINGDRKIGTKGLALIKSFEGCVLYVYDDLAPPVNGKYREWDGGPVRGTLTIGIGHTDAAKHPLKIKHGLRITESLALEILSVDLADVEEEVRRQIKVRLTQGVFDALVSFTYNCGSGSLANIAARINRGAMDEARSALDLYVKSKGITLKGLQRRRDAEQALWDMGDYVTVTIDALGNHAEITGVALPTEPHGVDHPAEVDQTGPHGPQDAPGSPSNQKQAQDTAAIAIGAGGALMAILAKYPAEVALGIVLIALLGWLAWGHFKRG